MLDTQAVHRYASLMLLTGMMLLFVGSSFAQGTFQVGAQNGTISGRILSVDGTPAANVRVAAAEVRDTPAQEAIPALLSIAQTDSAGRYRLENVPPGRYYITAGWVDAPTYFPGVATQEGATVLTVMSGATVEGHDFRLAVPFASLKITGRVILQGNQTIPLIRNLVQFERPGQPLTSIISSISPDGTFGFSNVRPGTYQVAVAPGSLPVNVVLVDKDITGLELVAPVEVRVNGTVTLQGGSVLPRIQLRFTNAMGRSQIPTAGPDFTTPITTGEWRLTVNGRLPAGYVIKSMTDGTTDLLVQTLKIAAGDSPRIAITLGVSSPPPGVKVSGHLTGRGATSNAPGTISMTSTAVVGSLSAPLNPGGSFEFPTVLPGTYFIDAGSFFTKIVVGNTDLTKVEIAAPEGKDVVGEFVKIQPGEFMMGCSLGDSDCADDEKPAHHVRITKGFEIGKYEVTQAQWESVMGTSGSAGAGPSGAVNKGANLPMPANWNDAQAFISRVNAMRDGNVYRLPTEAEWEYAARAGTTGVYPGGTLDAIAWYPANSGFELHPVGQKQSNAWGLHDMLGNVFEWTQDGFDPEYYAKSSANDPAGPVSHDGLSEGLGQIGTPDKVGRGGGFNRPTIELRVSARRAAGPNGSGPAGGFRLVREAMP